MFFFVFANILFYYIIIFYFIYLKIFHVNFEERGVTQSENLIGIIYKNKC